MASERMSCPKCGAQVYVTDSHCLSCGVQFDEGEVVEPGAPSTDTTEVVGAAPLPEAEHARGEQAKRGGWFRENVGWAAGVWALLGWPVAFGLLWTWHHKFDASTSSVAGATVCVLCLMCGPVGVALGACGIVIGVRQRRRWTIAGGVAALLSGLALSALSLLGLWLAMGPW